MRFNLCILIGMMLLADSVCLAAELSSRPTVANNSSELSQGQIDNLREFVKTIVNSCPASDAKSMLQDLFYEAAMCSNPEVVEIFLQHPGICNVNGLHRREKANPLSLAIAKGHLAVAEKLIIHGADVNAILPANAILSEELPVLWFAAYPKNKDALELLLKYGAHINNTNRSGETTLMHAARIGRIDVAQLLIAYGADVNAGHVTPLMAAAQSGATSMVAYLLSNNADVHAVGQYGMPVLMYALHGKQAAIVDMVINAGADVHSCAVGKTTSLMVCVFCDNVESAQILIKHGVALDLQDERGFTALMHAAMSKKSADMLDLLLEQGANPLLLGHKHHTAISCAFLGPKQDLKRRLKTIFRHVPKSYRPTVLANPQKIAQTNDVLSINIMREALHEVIMEQFTLKDKCLLGCSAIAGIIGAYFFIKRFGL